MPAPRIPEIRSRISGALLARVAGPDPTSARDRIHRTPGPRWFGPDSPIGRVHGDASMFVGGVRALLLQSLHPRAMAAVAAHSGYRGDPWGRLQRTATFVATTTFGTADDAAQIVAVVRAVHARISGTTSQGLYYEASDPHLLRWVHMAEVDSFLMAHQRYGRVPLDPEGCDEYVAQTAVVGHALGATDLPLTLRDLHAQLAAYRHELGGTQEAWDAARFLLLTPPLPWAARPAYGLIAAAGVGLMPRWTRRPLRLPSVPPVEATLVRAGGRLVTSTIRWALDAVDPAEGVELPDVVPPEPVHEGRDDRPGARPHTRTVSRAAT